MAKRVKLMPVEEFLRVMQREWAPVHLVAGLIPAFLQRIPDAKLHAIVASGTRLPGLAYSDDLIPSGELIGGIDVYRNAPDDPVPLNKDWYAVIRAPDSDAMFLVPGPFRDDEHWLDELPIRVQDAEVLALPRRSGP
jgi:hypothetical protein